MRLDRAFSHITAMLLSHLLNNKMNLLLPNIIPKFIFFWLSKTKTNRKKIPMTMFTVSSKSGTKLNKVCPLYLGRLQWDMNWSSATQSTLGGWGPTRKYQGCWKHLCSFQISPRWTFSIPSIILLWLGFSPYYATDG